MRNNDWVWMVLIMTPLFFIQRSCSGRMNPRFDCNDQDTYCYSWKGTDQLAAVIARGGSEVEIRTPVGTGQGHWTGRGDAAAKVFFNTRSVVCLGIQSRSLLSGFPAGIGVCSD